MSFDFSCEVDPSFPCWIEIESVDGVVWHHSPQEPIGCQAAAWSDQQLVRLKLDAPAPKDVVESESSNGPWRYLRGTYGFRIDPQPYPFQPQNVLSGVSRPDRGANIWIADPAQGWPHWLELDFHEMITFGTIQITFDSNLDRQMDEGAKTWTGPVPEIVKCYSVAAWEEEEWLTFLREQNNHQRWRHHTFEPVATRRIRMELEGTHAGGNIETRPDRPLVGPQSAHPNSVQVVDTARIFEVRVYAAKH